MNPVIETIMNRRSVRQFEEKAIPLDVLETIVAAGNAAPSGANVQAWRFVVVETEAYRKKLAELALPRYKGWIVNAPQFLKDMRKEIDAVSKDPIYYSAPVIIFVIGSGSTKDTDSAMVCENMMLAARSLGLGSCWTFFGQLVLDDNSVRNNLELKEDEKVYGPIVLGYPKGGFPPSPPKKAPVVKKI